MIHNGITMKGLNYIFTTKSRYNQSHFEENEWSTKINKLKWPLRLAHQ